MKLVKMKGENQFAIAGISFAELKVIKEACKTMAGQGSDRARSLAEALGKEMEEVEI